MMKRILQIALLALWGAAVPAAARAVTVPQQSAADYIFTRPVLTNHIRGVIIDVTNAYGVIRSEDVDWIREAVFERNSIRAGDVINGYGVGPVVGRDTIMYDDVSDFWNGFPRGSDDGWLDPDTQLLEGIRLYQYDQPVTNVYTVKRIPIFGPVTNSVTVIEMPMTNGSMSVYTNNWNAYANPVEDVIATNIHEWTALDYCQPEGAAIFGGLTNIPHLGPGLYTSMRFTPTISVLSNMFERLRGTTRLADVLSRITSEARVIGEESYDFGGQTYRRSVTNMSVSAGEVFKFYAGDSRAEHSWFPEFTAESETRFKTSILTTGGTSRVSIEAAYAHCTFSYLHGINSGLDHDVLKYAVVRLQNPNLYVSGDNSRCRVPVNPRAICTACAAAAGVPGPPNSIGFREESGVDETWSLYLNGITIIYRITPSTKLPSW